MSPASYKRRSAAWLVDLAVAASPLFLLSPVLIVMLASGSSESRLAVQFSVMASIPVILILYFLIALIQGARRSPTLGMRLLKIKRSGSDGAPPGLGSVLLRELALGLLVAGALLYFGLLPLLALIPISALILPDRSNVFDALSGQRIVSGTDQDDEAISERLIEAR